MQRAVERRGIPTVSPSVARDVTEHAKPPRAVFLPFMMGHHFGVPFHRELQRRIILECLDHLVHARESGEIRALPITWAQARKEGVELERLRAEGV
ncbi:MAG: hypothetical protein H0T44_12590 [Gemmatimonadales bacterium]|nr:hypothetical protein [Gemmatimonadales bacterium]MDQ3426568.1 hypothetical protein [Gemmatimonadota bacterium]